MVRLVVSPFDLSRTLPVGGDLLVACSSPGPRKTTHANGYYVAWPGWAVPVRVRPLTLGLTVVSGTPRVMPYFCTLNLTL